MKEHEFTCNTAFHSPITAARCRCRVTGCVSSLRSSYLSRWRVSLPRPLVVSPVPALRKREGFGGEKAAAGEFRTVNRLTWGKNLLFMAFSIPLEVTGLPNLYRLPPSRFAVDSRTIS